MAGRFVRASKYRHIYGQPTKKEQCYDNLRISRNAWDTNLIKANPEYIAVNWESSGGGAFAVIPVNERGKLPERLPLFRGHTAAVLDTDWNPFDDNLIASASDDAKVFLWRVPKAFTLHTDSEEPADVTPVGRLTGHTRKVGHVLFNPAAQNVLASSSGDFNVKLWDIEKGKDRLNLKHADIVQSMSWSGNGALLVTTSRDKKLRVWDVRQEKPAHEVAGHSGAKNSRAVWLGDQDRIATTGFSRMSDRQLGLWDIREPSEPLGGFQLLDSISGVCMPFWDDGTKCLYLAGKGDGNIRYFEYQNDKFEYLSEYKSADPQRGIAFLPKRGVNVHENEIARAYKTVNDTYVEPISFIVPRRAEVFQTDIYPPTVGLKSAMTSGEWFDGKTVMPPMISLKGRYDGGEADEMPADYKPPVAAAAAVAVATPESTQIKSPPPTKTQVEAPKPAPVPEPVVSRGPASVKENKKAMEDMATKFADKDDESEHNDDDDDDASSFEEVAKPIERPRAQASEPAKPVPIPAPVASRAPAPAAVKTSTPNLAATPAPSPEKSQPSPPASSLTPSRPSATSLGEGLKTHLSDIKSSQENTLSEINDLKSQVKDLADMVHHLTGRLDSLVGNQSERIRRVELEVESLRE